VRLIELRSMLRLRACFLDALIVSDSALVAACPLLGGIVGMPPLFSKSSCVNVVPRGMPW
jgi:hypothetical protein